MTRSAGKSLTVRLTLLFATVSGAVLLVLGVVVGDLVNRHFVELDQEQLNGKLQLVRHALAAVRVPSHADGLGQRVDATLIGEHELAVRIRRAADGQLMYESNHAHGIEWQPAAASHGTLQLTRDGNGRSWHLLSGQATVGPSGGPGVIVDVATSLHHHQAFMASFQAALWIAVGLAAVATGMLGWAAARHGLAPLQRISRDAARITAERLDRRLPVGAIPVELAEVAREVNRMLDRLQPSFRRLTEFSSDLAHELRTPVSNLLTQTQVILSKPRTADEYREVLASNAEEYERLSRTIADMLFLAKADNDLLVPDRQPVDLREQTDALAEFYGAVAEEKGISVTVVGTAQATGDPLMLRRAIGNLLSNACRHTPGGGNITVALAGQTAGMATVTVKNTGETIPPEHLPHLFERFYRADASRKHDADGSGLGLAITRSIMRAHGGEARVRSADGVTVFELRLPA